MNTPADVPKFHHFCVFKPVLWGADGNLHFPVSSIKPSLQNFQFCRVALPEGILFSLLYLYFIYQHLFV
jgi:hypothetical protein